MGRSDDLVPLLTPQAGKAVTMRQGVIVSWDQETAENVVLVGGTLMENLPILNTSEAAILAEDDVVNILVSGNTWGILGRMTVPGTPEAVSALSALRTQSADVLTSQSTSNTSFTDLTTVGPSVEIPVGPSGRALVIVSAEWTGITDTAFSISTGGGAMGYEMSGANSSVALDRYAAKSSIRYAVTTPPAGFQLQLMTAISRVTLRTGLTPGLTTFTAKYRSIGGLSLAFVNRNITVMAL